MARKIVEAAKREQKFNGAEALQLSLVPNIDVLLGLKNGATMADLLKKFGIEDINKVDPKALLEAYKIAYRQFGDMGGLPLVVDEVRKQGVDLPPVQPGDEDDLFLMGFDTASRALGVEIPRPMARGGGSVSFTERVSQAMDLGPGAKMFIGWMMVAAGVGAWGFNSYTTAQGMAGANNKEAVPHPILLGVGAAFNFLEIGFARLILSPHVGAQFQKLSARVGGVTPDQVQKTTATVLGIALGAVYVTDAIMTFQGLEPYFGPGVGLGVMRGFVSVFQTVFSELCIGMGEDMIREASEENKEAKESEGQ